ncbi:hypothetical protein B296_00013042, partial [Ensete ventricosum]
REQPASFMRSRRSLHRRTQSSFSSRDAVQPIPLPQPAGALDGGEHHHDQSTNQRPAIERETATIEAICLRRNQPSVGCDRQTDQLNPDRSIPQGPDHPLWRIQHSGKRFFPLENSPGPTSTRVSRTGRLGFLAVGMWIDEKD